jgi:hypothetical protein
MLSFVRCVLAVIDRYLHLTIDTHIRVKIYSNKNGV